ACMSDQTDPTKAVTTNSDGLSASAFLVAEDPDKPSTWHLQVRDKNGDVDHRLLGAAWAALHQGYRGNTYEGPGKDDALSKLRALYKTEKLPPPDGSKALGTESGGAMLMPEGSLAEEAAETPEEEAIEQAAFCPECGAQMVGGVCPECGYTVARS